MYRSKLRYLYKTRQIEVFDMGNDDKNNRQLIWNQLIFSCFSPVFCVRSEQILLSNMYANLAIKEGKKIGLSPIFWLHDSRFDEF